jgi:hypothetical protein
MSLDFQDRLRKASFVSPTGIEAEFLTDTLIKKGGKKTSTHEIVDSDESITQDQGNETSKFPLAIYFTNDEFDISITEFEALLRERYSIDAPGVLRHPLWGDINVCPTTWESSIELVNGVGIGKMTVSFIEMFPRKYPESTLNNTEIASADVDEMSLIDSASSMAVSAASAASNVAGKVRSVVGVISSAAEFLEKAEDEFTAIQNEITNMIDDVAGNILEILLTTQRLMRAPSRFIDSTQNKINVYKDMCADIISEIKDDKESDPVNLRNNAILIQTFAGYAVGCLGESALYTNFQKRSDVSDSIDSINEALENYNTALANARTNGNISSEYSGDHNFQSLLFDMIARSRDILLSRSFSLKAEKKFKLKNRSDIISLCWEYYSAVDSDTILFFIDTNNIKQDEFLELAAGREIVVYV